MQRYLKPNNLKIKKDEAQTIFKMRSRVTEVKTNYKGKYDTFECDLCKIEEESQEHILKCTEILKTRKDDKTHRNIKILSMEILVFSWIQQSILMKI